MKLLLLNTTTINPKRSADYYFYQHYQHSRFDLLIERVFNSKTHQTTRLHFWKLTDFGGAVLNSTKIVSASGSDYYFTAVKLKIKMRYNHVDTSCRWYAASQLLSQIMYGLVNILETSKTLKTKHMPQKKTTPTTTPQKAAPKTKQPIDLSGVKGVYVTKNGTKLEGNVIDIVKMAAAIGETVHVHDLVDKAKYHFSKSKNVLLEIKEMHTVHIMQSITKTVRDYFDTMKIDSTTTIDSFFTLLASPQKRMEILGLVQELQTRKGAGFTQGADLIDPVIK